MSLPSADEIRSRIESVHDEAMRLCLMTTYLYCGRISEVIGKAYPSDQTVGRGPTPQDVSEEIYKVGEHEYPAIVFTVRTAKLQGKIRKVALPTKYEQWAEEIYRYFQARPKNQHVFPYYRQNVSQYVHEHAVFDGLEYQIETYKIYENGELVKNPPDHWNPYTIHALRHQRATELVEFYGFDGFNLAAYGGWTISTSQAMFGVRTPRVFSRYLYLQWQGYFSKLLKRRNRL